MRGLALCTKSHWLVSEHRRFAFADIRRSPMSNSKVQSAKAIAEDIAHLCCVPDDWRLQISDLAAWPFPTFCAKPRGGEYVLVQPFVPHPQLIALQFDVLPIACMNSDIVTTLLSAG